jgi:hypothetical protein
VPDIPELGVDVDELGEVLGGVFLLELGAAEAELHSPPVVDVDYREDVRNN